MKKGKQSTILLILTLSISSIFCSFIPNQDNSTSATSLAWTSTQATQLTSGIPTSTNLLPTLASSPSFDNIDGKKRIPTDFPCPVEDIESVFSNIYTDYITIWDYFFATSNIGFVSIGPCAILRTDDGGLTWKFLSVPTTNAIRSIYFFDPSNGWAAGENGTLLKTTNGGLSWEIISTEVDINFRVVKFLNNQIGWVAGDGGIILYTQNAGISWYQGVTNTQVDIHDLDFSNPNNGIAVAEEGLSVISAYLYTTDGGKIWKVHKMNDPEPEAVTIVDDEIWIVGGWTSGTIWKLDREQLFLDEWYKNQPIKIFENPSGRLYKSVYFTDSKHGWAVGERGLSTFTQDGGDNWIPMPVKNIGNTAWNMIRFVSQHEAILAGVIGAIWDGPNYNSLNVLHSYDDGRSWQ